MKRRSARPFMVEVKQTRTARTSLTSASPRTRPDKTLWPELAQAVPEAAPQEPRPAPAPRQERKEPEAPPRRVLPSLVPMFDVPAEPVPVAVHEAVDDAIPAPRVRRARTERAPADGPAKTPRKPAAPRARPTAPSSEIPAAPVVAAPPVPTAPGQAPSPRAVTGRRTTELRLGERWKRRLPAFMR
jgi:hypothetical protein